MPRTFFPQIYGLALMILAVGCLMLAVWLVLLVFNALDYTNFSFLAGLLEIAVLTAVAGILLGAFLDYGITQNRADLIVTETLVDVVITKRNYNVLLTILYSWR